MTGMLPVVAETETGAGEEGRGGLQGGEVETGAGRSYQSEETLASDILTLLSEIEEQGSQSNSSQSLYYEAGRRMADLGGRLLASNIVISDVGLAAGKLTDFMAESALALGKTILLCTSALVLGILPGKGVGNTWPPYRSQVFGPEISTYFLDPYSFLHFEVIVRGFMYRCAP